MQIEHFGKRPEKTDVYGKQNPYIVGKTRLCWLAYYRLCVNLCVGKRHYTLQDNIHLISLMLQVSYHTIDLCFVLFMFTSKISIIKSEIISISIMNNPFLPFAVIPSSTVCLLLKCSNATVL